MIYYIYRERDVFMYIYIYIYMYIYIYIYIYIYVYKGAAQQAAAHGQRGYSGQAPAREPHPCRGPKLRAT